MADQQFKYDAFLSYASADKAAVRELADRLAADRLRVWLDDWVIQPGDSIPLAIQEGLESSRTLVLVMSQAAFASEWVTLEQNTALFRDPTNRQRRFIPLRLDDCDIKDSLKQFAYVDWRKRQDSEYARLRNACRDPDAQPLFGLTPYQHELEKARARVEARRGVVGSSGVSLPVHFKSELPPPNAPAVPDLFGLRPAEYELENARARVEAGGSFTETSQIRHPFRRNSVSLGSHVLLSYYQENSADGAWLYQMLSGAGHDVLYQQELLPGMDKPQFKSRLKRNINAARAVIICLSAEVNPRRHQTVLTLASEEYGRRKAMQSGDDPYDEVPDDVYLIPVRFSNCEIPDFRVGDRQMLADLEHLDLFPADHRQFAVEQLFKVLANPRKPASWLVNYLAARVSREPLVDRDSYWPFAGS